MGAGAAVTAMACLGGVTWGLSRLTREGSNPDQVARDVQRIRPEKMEAVAKAAQLVPPQGCKWLDGYYYYWQEFSISARFQLPAASLEAFLRDSKLAQPVSGLRPKAITSTTHVASKHDPQWHPLEPAKVSGVEGEDLVSVARYLMFDLDQADVITVYLIVNDTNVSVTPSAAATL